MAMKITVQQLMRAVPTTNRERAAEFVQVFNEWNERFQINTPQRVCFFLAHVLHESGNLRYVEENLNYSADGLVKTFPKYFTRATAAAYARQPEKIANKVYGGRYGNGNEASGDGWRYRGRGLIQLTFKDNYRAYQNSGFCNGNLLAHPEWLAKAPGHTKSAMWFWYSKGCNELADRDDNVAVTKKINGGLNGYANRDYLLRRFKKEFGVVKY